jgi:Uma2 family endonuclease
MATAPKRPDDGLPRGITVDEFLVWYEQQPGRYELHDGNVYAMSPERLGYAGMKFKVQRALADSIQQGRLPCHMVPDGVAVYVSDRKWYEPDAQVYCGPKANDDDTKIDKPVIVVEVVSPSSTRLDKSEKLIGYFAMERVQHYLIVLIAPARIIHHQRQSDGNILTRLLSSGPLRLEPPGIEIDVNELLT